MAPLAVAGALAAIALLPYVRIHHAQGIRRDLADVVTESGEFQQLVFADQIMKPMGRLLPDKVKWDSANEPGLFPLLAIAAYLLVCALRRRRPSAAVVLPLTFAFAAFALFFGPYVKLNFQPIFRGPFYWLWSYVPGFDGIRAIRRIAGFVSLGLCAAAAPALALLLPQLLPLRNDARGRLAIYAAAGASALLVVVEGWAAPVPLRGVPHADSPAYAWLSAHRDGGPVLELPLRVNDEPGVKARLAARETGHPTLDGHSGFDPPFFRWIYDELARGNQEVILQSGARYVVIDPMRPMAGPMGKLVADLPGVRAIEGVTGLYELPLTQLTSARLSPGLQPLALTGAHVDPGAEAALDGKRDTIWSTGQAMRPGDSITLTLDRPQPLAAIAATPGERTWDFPRGLEVLRQREDGEWELAGKIAPPLLDLAERPHDQPVAVPLDGKPGRRWRLVQMGRSAERFWSIAELTAYVKPGRAQ